jgi:hypothetical protein
METVKSFDQAKDNIDPSAAQTPHEGGGGEDVPAWELIDTGRYRPRRIKGSYRGRELG